MPRFEPFRALRYAADVDLQAVLAPPYDVQSDADTAALAARDPRNIVHIDVPPQTPQGYASAAETLARFVAEGTLVPDDAPSLTIYRMEFTDATGEARHLVGVLGALEVVDAGAGGVLPHERTTPKASTDRLDLTRATSANLSPVWGLALAHGLTAALQAPGEPIGEYVDGGVRHSVERVVDPERIAAIRAAIEADDVLIADGHHRYGVARAFRDEVAAAAPGTDVAALTDAAGLTLAYVGELVPEQLSVEAIHRIYTGVSAAALRERLAGYFEITPAPEPTPALLGELVDRGALALLTPDGASWLTPRPGAFEGVRALDGAWLEHALDGLDATVAYQHGLTETAALVADGTVAAAILIRPVSLAEIERTAREGLLMPPKSTFFTPKLLTGWVVRDLTR